MKPATLESGLRSLLELAELWVDWDDSLFERIPAGSEAERWLRCAHARAEIISWRLADMLGEEREIRVSLDIG